MGVTGGHVFLYRIALRFAVLCCGIPFGDHPHVVGQQWRRVGDEWLWVCADMFCCACASRAPPLPASCHGVP